VSVGNLYRVKGHEYLIDALGMLAANHPRLHLAISGRGDMADRSRRARTGAGRGATVFTCSDCGRMLRAVLAAADIFVLPSLSEGLPLALLEAMFAACPIIASDVGDVAVALAQGGRGNSSGARRRLCTRAGVGSSPERIALARDNLASAHSVAPALNTTSAT
jgi:glycosyltransferase involved in cell wall biosynthesis